MAFDTFVVTITAIAGIFQICMALVTTTKNLYSATLFKIIPFFLGCGLVLVALKTGGVI